MIDPAKLAPLASSVNSSVQSEIEKRLQNTTEAFAEYHWARKTVQTTIIMDFPAFRTHSSIQPEEFARQIELYVGDLESREDAAEDILAEMNRLD